MRPQPRIAPFLLGTRISFGGLTDHVGFSCGRDGEDGNSMTRVIVSGLIAQHSQLGGVAWDYLNVVLGLDALGHEVFYIEDSGEWPYNLDGGTGGQGYVASECTENISKLALTLDAFGLGDRWSYRFPPTGEWFGLSDTKRNEVISTAEVLLNVSGTLNRPEDYRAVQKLVYIDTDPAFTQIGLLTDQALRHRIDLHDSHFTVGENVCLENTSLPYRWKPTKHPIFLAGWRHASDCRAAFTTVMNWTSYKPVVYRDKFFGQKDLELTRFLDLPKRVSPVPIEISMPTLIHTAWESSSQDDTRANLRNTFRSPHDLLRYHGWHVLDSTALCGDFSTYRKYLITSKAEWSVAKNGYVTGNVGWFSGRSACYLAAGRPVVVQDTGLSEHLPTGLGVLLFSSMDEATDGIRNVVGSYRKHARAALEIAETYFDSSKVLTNLLGSIS